MMSSSSISPHLGRAGRLLDPEAVLHADPRLKPTLLKALAEVSLDGPAEEPAIDRTASPERLAEWVKEAHEGFEDLYEAIPNELPGDRDDVSCTTETIVGVDGNDIPLRIYRSPDSDAPSPCVVYLHGGAMTILNAFNKVHRRWCEDLAATGMVVVGVDFRNAHGAAGLNPFPSGLNDCGSAVRWVHSNRERLGITRIVLEGESGGGNLALASALQARRDGYIDCIDGVYAVVPYISGGYHWDEARQLRDLPSLVENNGYVISCEILDLLVATYDPTGANAENPLCWPHFAIEADLAGLPPHVITVNELDPLRDEGVAYYRKLLRAGVPAVGRVNLGLTHAAELIFRQAVSEDYFTTIHDIKRFADGAGSHPSSRALRPRRA